MLRLVRVYVWRGVTNTGKLTAGVQIANEAEISRMQLRRQGVIVTHLHPSWRLRWSRYPVHSKEVAHFSTQLAYLLRAGIALLPALNYLAQQYTATSLMKAIVIQLKSALENGMTLSQALRQHPNCFSVLYCQLVGISEQCGNLESQLLQLADYQKRLVAVKQSVYKALYYPFIIITVACVVITLLILLVVPQFEDLFHTVGVPLPYSTRLLLGAARSLEGHGPFGLVILIGNIPTFVLFRERIAHWTRPWNGVALNLPWVGGLLKKAVITRFAYTLSVTLKAGLPLLDALAAIVELMHYHKYKQAILSVRDAMLSGLPLDQALLATSCFPDLLIQMVKTGQLSGQLPENLAQVAALYETEVRAMVDRMISFLEPTLLLILGVMVALFMLALYLPIFELGSVLGSA